MSPPTRVFGPRTAVEAATGRRAAKAHRKAARLVQANVIAQCDTCGATDDAEHRVGRTAHEGCTGRFRFYGSGT